jgi:hypothetical protein
MRASYEGEPTASLQRALRQPPVPVDPRLGETVVSYTDKYG